MTEMTINKLPSKTWYWLKVNETKLPWDFEHTTELPEENISVGQEETARFSITGEGEYSSKKINIHAAKARQQRYLWIMHQPEKLRFIQT